MVVVHELSAEQSAAVLDLADRAAEADGVAPLSEQTLLAVRHGGGEHHLVQEGSDLAGYAFAEAGSAEAVVDPAYRRRGIGGRLLAELPPDARIWAHGDLPGAAELAASQGLSPVRTLIQMRRPLGEPLPVTRIHAGYTLRTFQPGDAAAWLRLNAASFASHPEQGKWTEEDLRRRMGEPWFDPKGFFVVTKDDKLVGFHWTKVHPDGMGEVYVVGVDPAQQGVGLGRTLTLAGLHHLKGLGLDTVLLYVDGENTSAVRLYESLGFRRYQVDVMFGRSFT
ncbi:mycothiol synthase [Actinocorallia sp. A-T 12471]|uniref:mycothiol synthase n=1 Tax=Actinocorallia sp. A-T 12471 TaxID=3089813 RepID=UPI0029D18AAD|nr:mycothiol synthase [Actinocorallia sp. A-T 12471]MDX6738182.1 mycothiol synthase [Actinocorallia sp. A-T 12471]